ncbi:hypothetical protein T492DRAFT_620697 [Pavlovales sp. CCMP2436]|nr:hypothetical protein T492DRAFT_620697 [Pavlovales sp. CCMP2436]|mmetsp:Transcript_25698/g.65216  ORF Transcript_25698/g.65216 Transcript_25698/m.65216 type:complete len:220 (+) Transcript_25698:106-765(+)
MAGALLLLLLAAHTGSVTQRLLSRVNQLAPGGIGATALQRAEVGSLVAELEAQRSPFAAPATQDAQVALSGLWRVLYADAPPPSNGRLGPFRGLAFQDIDVGGGAYVNDLRLGDEAKPWLRALLRANWEALDEVTWRVNFRTLTFDARFAGKELRLLEREFPEGTSRVWRFSYTGPDVRIVRAGQGGGKVSAIGQALGVRESGRDDDCLFVLQRVPRVS